MKTKTKTYIVKYGSGGVAKCRGTRNLADFLHNLCISYGMVAVTVEVEH
jgi:hypothetical protein